MVGLPKGKNKIYINIRYDGIPEKYRRRGCQKEIIVPKEIEYKLGNEINIKNYSTNITLDKVIRNYISRDS